VEVITSRRYARSDDGSKDSDRMPSLMKLPGASNTTKTCNLDYRMLRITLSLFLVLFPLSLFAAGHDISSIRYAPADAFPGQLAYNSNHFLSLGGRPHIFGSLDDAAGQTLAPAFAAVPFANSDVLQLTAGGSGYLAIWNQDATTPSLGMFDSEGRLERRVILDGDKFVTPRVAFNGRNVLVVDQIGFPRFALVISVYDLAGRLVSRAPLPIIVATSYAVTSTGTDFIVVSAGTAGVNEWRVAFNGAIISTLQIDPPPTHAVLSLYYVAVTAKNGRIAIAWEQLQFATVSSAVIQPDGNVTRSELPSGGLAPLQGVTILPVDTGVFVAWNVRSASNEARVFAARMNDDGLPLEARPIDLGDGLLSAAASSGNVVELSLLTSLGKQIKLIADVGANGISPRPPAPIAIMPVRQLLPVVSGNGAGFTAAWLDVAGASQNVVAGRVTATGQALDGSGITLGLQTSPPAIAHGSPGELMVWNANGHLLAARLLPSGALFDVQPLVIGPSTGSTAVAWSGSRFFIVWTDGRQLFGAFVGTDGTTTPPRSLGVQTPLSDASSVDLAWDGRQYIVVFAETTPGANPCAIPEGCGDPLPDHIGVVRVSSDGIAIDTTPVRVPGVHARVHVASSGAESMIALDSDRVTSAMIVRDDGFGLQLGPEIPLFNWFNSYGSDVAWNGSQYVVAWRYAFGLLGPAWIGVKTISQSGLPLASLFTPTAGYPENFLPFSSPSVAANDAGDAAIVISEVAPPSYTARARLYLLSELAPMPPPPRAPRNAVTYVTGPTTVITWQSDDTQLGFQTERSDDFGKTWMRNGFSGDVRSLTLVSDTRATLFRVSAFGPGGFSEPVVATFGRIERRRAERR